MCGLAGIISANGINDVQRMLIKKMADLQRHRGPDCTGFALYEQVAFAHNRLSLLDLHERSNQPFCSDDYCLIYNGEIYNFGELKDELIRYHGVRFIGTSDTEVLFHALIHWGVEKTLARVDAMFAFAFYDRRLRRVSLARDKIGIKPLFFQQTGGSLYFASELKALVTSHDPAALSLPRFMHAPLGTLEHSRKFTAFENIFQVEPGCCVSIDLSEGMKVRTTTYFKTTDWVSEREWHRLNNLRESEIDELFAHTFRKSVKSTLIADAGVGAFVSGGVDSSLNAAVAREFRPINLYTANVVGKFSEYKDARSLAEYLRLPLQAYDFEPGMFVRDWVACTWHYDAPIVDHPSAVPFQNVAAVARRNNDKAVLTGEGSDELFLGYPHLLVERFDRWILKPRDALTALHERMRAVNKYISLRNRNFLKDIGKMSFDCEQDLREASYKEAFAFLGKHKLFNEQLMTPSMVDNGLHSLLWRNDRMGMMNSIESRFPFLTEDMLRFGINLPVKFKLRGSKHIHDWSHPFLVDKSIVRRLAQKVLPKAHARLQKRGFPMYGLSYVRVDKELFLGGFWQEVMKMSDRALVHMIGNLEPSFQARLAAVEIWGRLFCWRNSIETVKDVVTRHARVALGEVKSQ